MSAKSNINVFIGTPAYGSMVHTDYLHSIISFYDKKIPFTIMSIGNESLVTRGRNTIISYFSSIVGFSNLLFLDADMYFPADGLIRLIQLNKDVIGVPVALKGFNKATGQPVYNVGKVLGEEELSDGSKIYKVDRVGTAVFMLSSKAVNALTDYAQGNKDIYYPNPHTRGDSQPDIKMYDIFKTGVFDGEYLSEDYYVCRILRELGFDVFVDPNIKTRHNGNYVFS